MFFRLMTLDAPALAIATTGGADDSTPAQSDFNLCDSAALDQSACVDFESGLTDSPANGAASGDGIFEIFWGTDRYTAFTWDFSNPVTGLFVDVAEFGDTALLTYDDGSGDGPLELRSTEGERGGTSFAFDNPVESLTFSTPHLNDWGTMDNLYHDTARERPFPAKLPLLLGDIPGLAAFRLRRIDTTI